MGRIRYGVVLMAVLLFISGPVWSFNGIYAQAAVATRTENAQTREYTPQELCCMAQYYYMRTSKDGIYPPEVICTNKNDAAAVQAAGADTAAVQAAGDTAAAQAAGADTAAVQAAGDAAAAQAAGADTAAVQAAADTAAVQNSGTNAEETLYTIGLSEKVADPDGSFHYTTYAWYEVDVHGKGTDTLNGKEVDLTVYSKVYSPDELCSLAKDYYYRTNDFYPPKAEYTLNSDGTYTIHLFEDITDAEGVVHSATCGWLTVNVCGIGQDDLTLQAVNINP